MRHRFVISIYDDNLIDEDLLEYIFSHDGSKRQEVLRTLLRAGFSSLIQYKNNQGAMLSSIDRDSISIVINSLMNSGNQSSIQTKNKKTKDINNKIAEKELKKVVDKEGDFNNKKEVANNDLIIYKHKSNSSITDNKEKIDVDDLVDHDPSLEDIGAYEHDVEIEYRPNKEIKDINSEDPDDIEDPMIKLSRLF